MVTPARSYGERPALPRHWWPLVGLLALAFLLRIADLGAVPLRGDEAFALRYWADEPARSFPFLIDQGEPHPLGAYLLFWVWKSAAGSSEVAMRTLPLLGNMLGVAAVAALARRLWGSTAVTLMAALLWAINPLQIWHAQDIRNYALWAGLSPLSMLLWLRLAGTPPSAGRSSVLGLGLGYVLVEALALYSFFLEAFMLPVQFAYVVIVRRSTTAARRMIAAWSVLLLLLIPWFWQLWRLAGVGYHGTAEPAAPVRLLTRFLPTLLVGPETATWPRWAALGWLIALVAALWLILRSPALLRQALWLGLWMVIPIGLLFIAATRSSVFHPRYVIAVAPPLLLLVAFALARLAPLAWRGATPVLRIFAALPLAVLLVGGFVGLANLCDYYSHTDPKSPNWPTLVTYFENRIPPTGPHLVVQTLADPAFAYYYHGHAAEKALVPGEAVPGQLFSDTLYFRSIWLVGRDPAAEAFLQDHMQRLSYHQVADFPITQYRPWRPSPDEIGSVSEIEFRDPVAGDLVRLRGFTLQGPDTASQAITLLLYWEPLARSDTAYTVFVHLLGPANPRAGSPIWDQDDHEPLEGFARTTSWQPGDLIRDPYHLLNDPGETVPPGTYQIAVGLYDPITNTRLEAVTPAGVPLGDSALLATVTAP